MEPHLRLQKFSATAHSTAGNEKVACLVKTGRWYCQWRGCFLASNLGLNTVLQNEGAGGYVFANSIHKGIWEWTAPYHEACPTSASWPGPWRGPPTAWSPSAARRTGSLWPPSCCSGSRPGRRLPHRGHKDSMTDKATEWRCPGSRP